MTDQRTVLITGATGRQGGATLRALRGQGFALRAMTRKPASEAAEAVAHLGADVVYGDLDDSSSLEAALAGAWGVFAVQNTWEAGVEKEEEQGKRLAAVARKAGVQHFVYSSVASAQRHTGIPHFENKWRIEETVRGLKFPSHVIIRPVFFMENLVTPWFLRDDTLSTAMDPSTVLQMIAAADIGRYGARAFVDAGSLNRREIDIAGDAATMPRTAEVLGRHFHRRIAFVRVPIEQIRAGSDDFALMLEWFDREGYSVDIPGLQREFGIAPTTLDAWADQVSHG
ncbi:MAG: NmrA/HSCARG family protein [Acidobacteria bacterium]|nr:NmrA/HSCARG family protein [Acidobacteriota bacterium]